MIMCKNYSINFGIICLDESESKRDWEGDYKLKYGNFYFDDEH
jgi:hypothetical protein